MTGEASDWSSDRLEGAVSVEGAEESLEIVVRSCTPIPRLCNIASPDRRKDSMLLPSLLQSMKNLRKTSHTSGSLNGDYACLDVHIDCSSSSVIAHIWSTCRRQQTLLRNLQLLLRVDVLHLERCTLATAARMAKWSSVRSREFVLISRWTLCASVMCQAG